MVSFSDHFFHKGMYAGHCPQLDDVAENVISCFAGGRWIYDFLPSVHYHRAAYNLLHHPDVQVVSWSYTYIQMPSTDILNFHQDIRRTCHSHDTAHLCPPAVSKFWSPPVCSHLQTAPHQGQSPRSRAILWKSGGEIYSGY